jgi:hypothetical protein
MDRDMTRYRRRNKLPKPSLQLRLTLTFMGTLVLSILLQLMLTRSSMLRMAVDLPHDGAILLQEINSIQGTTLLLCFLVLLPVCFVVGVLSTFGIAGPIYRFEDHLRRLARGEDPGPCRIRKGDRLQDFCDLLNLATEPLRRTNARNALSSKSITPPETSPAPPSLVRDIRNAKDRNPADVEP